MFCQAAFRGIRKPTLHSALSEYFKGIEQQTCKFSVSSLKHMHPDDYQPPKGNIKKRYLKKYPLIRTAEDGTVTVEGVSNKAIPCPVPWFDPGKVDRFKPGEHASGDLGDVRSLVDEKHLDPTQPKVEYEISGELVDSSPEVKRVCILILFYQTLECKISEIRNGYCVTFTKYNY